MNLFEFFLKLRNTSNKPGWTETTARFTGEARRAIRKKRVGFYYNDRPADFNEYRIRYYTGDSECFGWYRFYPAPDPDPEDITGKQIKIRYKKSRPWDFEYVVDINEV